MCVIKILYSLPFRFFKFSYCNMKLLLLTAWIPAKVVTSCLQNPLAMQRDRTEKRTGRGVVSEREQCASASDWRTKSSQFASVIQCGEVDFWRLRVVRGTKRRAISVNCNSTGDGKKEE